MKIVKKACRESTIDEFKGLRIAIDVSCLLYKALHAGCPPSAYVKMCVSLLIKKECKVILVFDGEPLPEKLKTIQQRRSSKGSSKRRKILLTKKDIVTTIEKCKDMCDIIRAPNEADAQLAFLVMNGYADTLITEDSDLIVYGCKRIIYKFKLSGKCLVYEKSKLSECFSSIDFDFDKFRWCCVLAGCDYVPKGLRGFGLKKAWQNLEKVPDAYLKDHIFWLTQGNTSDFIQAYNIFLYHPICDPQTKAIKPLYCNKMSLV